MEDRKRLIRCIIDCMIGLLFNALSLANHDMRKTWCSGLGVYGTMLEVVRAPEFSLPGICATV